MWIANERKICTIICLFIADQETKDHVNMNKKTITACHGHTVIQSSHQYVASLLNRYRVSDGGGALRWRGTDDGAELKDGRERGDGESVGHRSSHSLDEM
ncbi:hypothetical protein EVAR_77710_1 [Eumeta japonica]|uniref:Uncharacterized protein n=1 Tax=Eumeta variegata TaxID=151549 RepID=A0A4C1TAS0_EUMVA|nr:hypothetical protein EVAR_77710_1 [Eumeta japonica]